MSREIKRPFEVTNLLDAAYDMFVWYLTEYKTSTL